MFGFETKAGRLERELAEAKADSARDFRLMQNQIIRFRKDLEAFGRIVDLNVAFEKEVADRLKAISQRLEKCVSSINSGNEGREKHAEFEFRRGNEAAERIGKIDARLERVESSLDQRLRELDLTYDVHTQNEFALLNAMDPRLYDLEKTTYEQFTAIYEQFTAIEKRFDRIERPQATDTERKSIGEEESE